MNFCNLREVQSSEDQHFLQNLREEDDLLNQFCKVQSRSEREQSYYPVKQQMEDEMQYNHIKKGSKDQKGSRPSKDKKKVFYRDKMAELMKPGEYVKQQYKYVTYTTADQNKIPISKEEQLKRNRESAKNSRQRKKEYIDILEKKNEQNTKIIGELTYKLQQVTLERDRLKQDHHAEIKNFCRSKAQAYQHLQMALKETQSTQDDIKALINDMMTRFGTSGSERIGIINYYMNEIIEVLVSDIHKYFLTCSSFVQNYAPNNPPKSIDLDVMRILRLDSTKLSSMVSKFKERFVKQTTVFKDLTQELYRIFKSIQAQGKVIELVFAEMMKEVDPKALGQLIVWFEQNRFCRQIKRVRRQWVEQLKAGQQVIEVIRKQTKQEHL